MAQVDLVMMIIQYDPVLLLGMVRLICFKVI